MPIRPMNVQVLELRGCRKNDIRVIGRVCLEMFQDNGEQILPP